MNKLFLLLILIASAAVGCGSESGGTAGIGAVGGAGGQGGTTVSCTTPEEILRCDGVVLNIAHRGGKLIRPEHTLLAYEQALADGSDVIELDLHATSDGVIVVMHDSDIDRTTNGTGAIKDMTFETLRTFDAGYNFTTDEGATYPYRGTGLLVPSLEEVFEAFPDVPYVVEIKQAEPSLVDDFIAIARDHEVIDQMNGASFSDDVIEELRDKAPEMATAFSEAEVIDFFLVSNAPDLDPEYVPPAEFLQVPPTRGGLKVLHDQFIPTAHALGLKVHVWTINDEEEMRTLIEDFGVDGIMTDNHITLGRVLEETGTGLPK